jgi:competence protein ComEA
MCHRWQRSLRFGLLSLLFLFCAVDGLAKKKPPLHPINLNTANAAQLELVPGIGPSTAEKILQARKSCGSFKDVDDLLAIRGIGQKRLDKMRKYLTVGNPPTVKKADSGSAPAAQGAAKGKAVPVAPKAATAKKSAPVERDEEEP